MRGGSARTLRPTPITAAPEETARIARAAVPKGNIYVQMRDVLGAISTDEQFVDLFAPRGRPVVPSCRLGAWRLALGAWRLALGAWRLALGAWHW
jgi:transposase